MKIIPKISNENIETRIKLNKMSLIKTLTEIQIIPNENTS